MDNGGLLFQLLKIARCKGHHCHLQSQLCDKVLLFANSLEIVYNNIFDCIKKSQITAQRSHAKHVRKYMNDPKQFDY